MLLASILVFLLGMMLVSFTLFSAVRMVVLPRGENVWLTRMFFQFVFRVFRVRLRRMNDYEAIDHLLAYFAPISLILLPILWVILCIIGFMLIFWAIGVRPMGQAFLLSGSSLLTLGFAPVATFWETFFAFIAAAVGLGIVALLIAYLPTMYSAFSKREVAVTLLEVRAGSPPSAITMIERYFRIHNLAGISEQWRMWETWFSELEESHTTFAPLPFFRSPQSNRSWITASGAVLDAAALTNAVLDIPHDANADLCIRAGYLALRKIADLFSIKHNAKPKPDDPISITRAEFDAACDYLHSIGVPLKADRDKAWRDFAGWHVNYDTVLLGLARLVFAPPSPWTGERQRTFEVIRYRKAKRHIFLTCRLWSPIMLAGSGPVRRTLYEPRQG